MNLHSIHIRILPMDKYCGLHTFIVQFWSCSTHFEQWQILPYPLGEMAKSFYINVVIVGHGITRVSSERENVDQVALPSMLERNELEMSIEILGIHSLGLERLTCKVSSTNIEWL